MQLSNYYDYNQYLFGLKSGFTCYKDPQRGKTVILIQSVLVTFGAYLFVRNKLNRHI